MLVLALAAAAAPQFTPLSETKLPAPSSSAARVGATVALCAGEALLSDDGMPDRLLVYREQNGAWPLQSTVNGLECAALSVDGESLIAGNPDWGFEGRAVALRRVGGDWQVSQYLWHPNWNNFSPEYYGFAVSLDGTRAAISNPTHVYGAYVHIWEYSPVLAAWRVKHEVRSGVPTGTALFGAGVALRGDELLVTSRNTLQHFRRDPNLDEWIFQGTLIANLSSVDGLFRRLAWSRTDVVAVTDVGDATLGQQTGALHVLERVAGQWSQAQKLHSSAPQGAARFGMSLSILESTIAVGAPHAGPTAAQGAVELFARNHGWRSASILYASDATPHAHFGNSLASETTAAPLRERLLVGSPGVGGILVMDGAGYVVEYEHAAARVYCTSKRNSLGCLPRVGFVGSASATGANPFTISASQVLNQRPGVFFYSLAGPAAVPHKGGYRCYAPPYRRVPGTLDAGGSPATINDCSGLLALDFNAWIRTGSDPSLAPGAVVWGQFFARDASASHGLSLSEGISFEIRP